MIDMQHYEIRCELERKTLDAIEFLDSRLTNGAINIEQFSIGVDALWIAVSGLIPRETMNLLSIAKEAAIEAVKDKNALTNSIKRVA